MMDLLRRALEYPGSRKEASPNRLEERQDSKLLIDWEQYIQTWLIN